MKDYSVKWSDKVGTAHKSETFDLYTPAKKKEKTYGLVVYLHAGGFATGDKADDTAMLQWLCSKGYVAAGINYTLRTVWFQDIVPVFLGVVFSGVCQDIVPRVMMGYGSFIA